MKASSSFAIGSKKHSRRSQESNLEASHSGIHRLFLNGGAQFGAGDALGESGEILDLFDVDDLRSAHHFLNDGGAHTVTGRE